MQQNIGTDIAHSARLLEEGKLVAIPTETVYGLAANALDTNAVLQIFEAKERPQFNPLIVHLSDWQEVSKYAQGIPPIAHLLAHHFCPGPLTFLLPKKQIIPDLVTAGSPLVAIRIPNHPISLALLQKINFPLAAPSANQFGYISPTTAQHVWDSLGNKVAYILDGEASAIGLESTIIGFDDQENVVLHRVGAVSAVDIEHVVDKKVIIPKPNNDNPPKTSGQLKSHYAPHAALYIGDIPNLASDFIGKKIATISFCKRYELPPHIIQFVLSDNADINEAASKLFSIMRQIDQLEMDIVLSEPFPEQGLGSAINDRLARAQAINK